MHRTILSASGAKCNINLICHFSHSLSSSHGEPFNAWRDLFARVALFQARPSHSKPAEWTWQKFALAATDDLVMRFLGIAKWPFSSAWVHESPVSTNTMSAKQVSKPGVRVPSAQPTRSAWTASADVVCRALPMYAKSYEPYCTVFEHRDNHTIETYARSCWCRYFQSGPSHP